MVELIIGTETAHMVFGMFWEGSRQFSVFEEDNYQVDSEEDATDREDLR